LIKHKSGLFILLASVFVVVMLVTSGCVPTTTPAATSTVTTTVTATPKTTTAAAVTDKTYRALSPIGNYSTVDIKSLAPRLDKLDGKTILFSQAEADPVIMPALLERVKKDYPTVNWVVKLSSATNPTTLTAEEKKPIQALIQGVGF
jgi:hypothetical protein